MEDRNYPSVGSWILTILILSLPIVNLIYLLVMIFAPATDESGKIKKDFCKAQLICTLIGIAIYLITSAVLVGSIMPAISDKITIM